MTSKETLRAAYREGGSLKNRVDRLGGIEKITEEQAEKLVKRFRLNFTKDAYYILREKLNHFDAIVKKASELNESHDVLAAISGAFTEDEHIYDAEIRKAALAVMSVKEEGLKCAKTYGEVEYSKALGRVCLVERYQV